MPKRRCSPIGTLSGDSGACRAIVFAWANRPPASAATLPAVARASTTAALAVSTTPLGLARKSPIAPVIRPTVLGSFAGDQLSSGTSRGVGSRSSTTVPMSTAETPSTIAWCVFVIRATLPSARPSTR
jgi:hypothetical protein